MSETHVHGIDEANMERRTFLKGSMTAAALLGAAGMFGCAPNAAKQEGMKQEEAETADMPDTGAVDPTAEYECWLPPQGEVAFESEPVTDIPRRKTGMWLSSVWGRLVRPPQPMRLQTGLRRWWWRR